jgi:hypoxia up-regulated 1
LDDIDAVEMIGGGQRIPSILSTLGDYFGERLPLGVHLNADESPALGAAFEAANISTMFKVRKTGMTDRSPWPVSISLKSIPKSTTESSLLGGLFSAKKTKEELEADVESDKWEKSTTLFKSWSKLDAKKLIAFHHDRDIMCEVSYAQDEPGFELLPQGTPKLIAQYNITGVSEVMKAMTTKGYKTCGLDGSTKPKMTLHFKLDSSGIVRLVKAEATCEQPNPTNDTTAATAATGADADSSDSTDDSENNDGNDSADSNNGDDSNDSNENSSGDEDKDENSADKDETSDETSSDKTSDKAEDDSMTKEEKKAAKKKAKKEAKKKEEEKKKKDKKNKDKKEQVFKLELGVVEDFSSPLVIYIYIYDVIICLIKIKIVQLLLLLLLHYISIYVFYYKTNTHIYP